MGGGGLALHGIIVHSHQLRTGLFGNTVNIANIGNTANICNIGNTANIGTHTNCPLAYLEAKSYDCISSAVDLKSPCIANEKLEKLLLASI